MGLGSFLSKLKQGRDQRNRIKARELKVAQWREQAERRQALDDRKKEMQRMRFDELMTCQEIADVYGISRERVRQIIGNTGTGFKPDRKRKAVAGMSDKTNEEASQITGIKSIWRYRRGQRHAVKKNTNISLGTDAEMIVSEKLKQLGIENELMPHGHVFDIRLCNGKTVDVKSRITKSLPPSLRGRTAAYWTFDCRKGKKGSYADFFILYIWETGDIFVVPDHEMGISQIRFCWPPAFKASKWHQYHNDFDLLK